MAVVGLVLAGASPASAVRYNGGMNRQSFCVQNPSGPNPTWATAINNGRNGWDNHANFPGNISVFSGCTSLLAVGAFAGKSWFGLYTPLITGVQYKIELHTVNISTHVSQNGYSAANVIRSTTAHEFGHSLRLDDHSNLPTRLMSSTRNRNTVLAPTTAEVTESNGYY